MEYPLSELPKAIYYFLTLHPNECFTFKDLRHNLMNENICTEFLPYVSHADRDIFWEHSCNTVCNTYENIKFENRKISLNIPSEQKYDMKLIENIINNPISYTSVLYDIPYDDSDQTILHILCQEGRIDLLRKLSNNFDLNLYAVNRNGQYIDEVIPSTSEGIKTMKTLFKLLRENHNSKLLNMKKLNTQLTLAMNIEKEKSSKLKKSLDTYIVIRNLFVALIVLVFSVIVCL